MNNGATTVTHAPTILLAAASAVERQRLRDALAVNGYPFAEAATGAECLTLAGQLQPAAVLIAARLTDPDAFTCVRQLRQEAADTPRLLLVVTDTDQEESAARAFESGADDYLTTTAPAGILRLRLAHLLQACEKRAEGDRLRRSYQLLLAHAGEGIVGFDREGRHTFLNATAQRLLGFTPDELLGQANYDLWQARCAKGEKLAPDQCPICRALFNGATCRDPDGLFWRKDGSPLPVEYVCTPTREHDGVAGAVLLFRDISEKKRCAEESQVYDEQVRQAQKLESLGILAGGIAHDFNNLLMIILGNAELIMDQLPADSPFRSPLDALQRAGQRATDLSKQMLTYAGRAIVTLSAVNLNTLIQGMKELLNVSLAKKTTLKYEFSPEMPVIEADVSQVRQLVFNLVTNAAEAIGDGYGEIVIRTGIAHLTRQDFRDTVLDLHQPEGEYVFVQVRDTGCGMDGKTQERMFDPFFSTKFTGRGLGLATVLGIMRSHGGAINVQSTPGKGTSMTAYFRSSRVFPHAEFPEAIPLNGRGETILVVDDESAILEVVRHVLERSNYQVLTAGDGIEALELLQKRGDEVALVLLDLKMPRMGGDQVFPIVHRTRPKLPVILTSGYSQNDAIQAFGSMGMAGFLEKPYEARKLLEEIANALRR
jgi:PAS domain S-box-containing protein